MSHFTDPGFWMFVLGVCVLIAGFRLALEAPAILRRRAGMLPPLRRD